MTTRSRVDRLADDHPCSCCHGTGVARRSPGAGASGHLSIEATSAASAAMLGLADQFADEAQAAAHADAAATPPGERSARHWAAILPDDLTGAALVDALAAALDETS